MSKTNKDMIEDDRWKMKGHRHPVSKDDKCPACFGTGVISYQYIDGSEHEAICHLCHGTGYFKQ